MLSLSVVFGAGDRRCYNYCSVGVPATGRRIQTHPAQNVWMNKPERSFGSNHVLFGGMI